MKNIFTIIFIFPLTLISLEIGELPNQTPFWDFFFLTFSKIQYNEYFRFYYYKILYPYPTITNLTNLTNLPDGVTWIRFRFILTIVQTGIPFLIEFQTSRADDTTYSSSMPACYVLIRVVRVLDVPAEVGSATGAFVGAKVCRRGLPFLCGEARVYE